MKKILAITLLMAMALCGMGQAIHFDFSITNSTGYEFYYRIIDAQNHWVEVTYPCQNGDNYWWGYDKPEGKLILADTVTYQGTDYTLVAIGDHAFCGCSGLRGTLEFPETIQSIGAGAFKGCSNFNGNLTIPASMTRIEDEAFYGCSEFATRLYLPDSLTYIGARAFQQCAFKGMLELPSTLSVIGDEAFKGCTSFNSISIKAVTPPTTGSHAFDEIPTWISVAVPYTSKDVYQNASGWSRVASRIIEKSYWNGKAEPWTKGSGTPNDPYLIESAENLAWLAKSVNERKEMVTDTHVSPGGGWFNIYSFYDVNVYQDTCFRLVIDVDLNKGENLFWSPIGNQHYINEEDYDGEVFAEHHTNNVFNQPQYYYYTYFSGQFDGNGHVISKAHYKSAYHVGLFGIVLNATVHDVTISELMINQNNCNACGGVIGTANNSTIYNCHTSGTIRGSYYNGGIVGSSKKCFIDGCTAQIDFTSFKVGGIVGRLICDSANTSQSGVFNCGFIGNMENPGLAGGIIGLCQSVSEGTGTIHIKNCFSRSTMTRICSDPPHYVETGNFIYGGIVGQVDNIDTLFLLNCYNNGTVNTVPANEGNHWYYGGGILAYANANTTIYIKNCYHVGSIVTQYKGGILPQNTNMTLVRNSFFDRTVAPDDGFGLPLDSDYMKTEAFVSQLNNGSSVFRMDTEPNENDGYPIFGADGLIFVGAEWYYEIHNDDGSLTYQHLQCTGDTTIQEKRPKIIIRSNTQYDSKGEHTTVTHEYVYEENGIVYWWNKDLQAFTVLYDFSAEVGDEWEIMVGSESIVARVYEMETQMIEGIPYKRMTIGDTNNLFSGTLISTIGHLTSFFPEKLMNQGKSYRVEGLRCYWLDGDLMLKLGDKDCDEVYQQYHNGIEEDGPSTGSGTFTVYPNPTNDILFVETRFIASQPTAYRITNLMGQTLLQGNITAETQQIDISSLPSGMYFISVGEGTVKFVVQ